MQRSIASVSPLLAPLVRTSTPTSIVRELLRLDDGDKVTRLALAHAKLSCTDAATHPVQAALAPPAASPRSPVPTKPPSLEVSIPKSHAQPYAHRTFMGLAGSMMCEPVWRACLQRCMPELHAACTADDITITRLMRLLEGNPVLAAYGLSRGDNKALPMEWDLWLDPNHPHDLQRARVIHGNTVATQLAATPEARTQSVAASIMDGSRAGTDVHAGLTPLAWMRVFDEASRCGDTPVACEAVYLDVKSSWSSASDVAAFVKALAEHHVATRGVLAFNFEQLAAPLQVPHAVHLAESPAGLAMVLSKIPHGGMAMFNGGALLQTCDGFFRIDPAQLRLVRAMQQTHDLRIGVYLQEDAVSPAALRVLIDCLNENTETFASGIAYGGLAGIACGLLTSGTGAGCQAAAIAYDNARWAELF